jgi:hypothetical protein
MDTRNISDPDNLLLVQNYLNPFNFITNISFTITNKSNVSLFVFNVSTPNKLDNYIKSV